MRELLFSLFIHLFASDKTTTDDVWNCWTEDDDSVEVCERELSPCHYVNSAAECVLVIRRIRLDAGTYCDLDDPLACLPEA